MHPWDSVAAVGLEVGTVLGFLAEFEANNATIFLKGLCSACSLLSTVVNFVMFIESQPLWSMHTQIHIAQTLSTLKKHLEIKNHWLLKSLNINGLSSPIKRHKLTGWAQKQDPLFCYIQETCLGNKDRHCLRVKG